MDSTTLPFRFGSDAEFAAVRDLFRDAGYTAEQVCARCGTEQIHQVQAGAKERDANPTIGDSLDVLIRLFMDGRTVPAATVESTLGPAGIGALEALGILGIHPRDPDGYAASVLLYPTADVYIASDLDVQSPGRMTYEELEPPEHVFSAITSLTGTYMSQLPESRCERFLELCAGTGIAALAHAGNAGHVWALDITERCTRFAEFNARLNGVSNMTALQGDLYDPVRGMTFDRIVVHPPYVPATETELIYRDGGEDGEDVIRRIMAGLPEHLGPGGRFYLTSIASDRKGALLEDRIRKMIGERESEFDLLLVTHFSMTPPEYYGRLASSGRISFATSEQRQELFRRLEAEQLVYCSLTLQRHESPREAFTLRRERTDGSSREENEWLVDWSTRILEGDVIAELLESRPRLSSRARLEVNHRVEGGEWKVESCKVRMKYPFVRTVDISLNAAMLLTLCDGEHTVREILQRIQDGGALGPEVSPESFGEFIRELVTEGVVEIGDGPRLRPEAVTVTTTASWPQ